MTEKMNLGETPTETETIEELHHLLANLTGELTCLKADLDRGEYGKIVFHLARICVNCAAAGEETVVELLTDDDIEGLLKRAYGNVHGQIILLIEGWKVDKAEAEDEIADNS